MHFEGKFECVSLLPIQLSYPIAMFLKPIIPPTLQNAICQNLCQSGRLKRLNCGLVVMFSDSEIPSKQIAHMAIDSIDENLGACCESHSHTTGKDFR